MSEEIKEIIDELRKTADNTVFAICCSQEELDKIPRYTANFMSINDKKAKILLNYITNLQKENELHNKILKDANDVLNIQAQKGNYNYDSYMLGLYNGMEMIVSLFEQREPKFKSGKDIKFLHETDYKSRNEKAIEYIKRKK